MTGKDKSEEGKTPETEAAGKTPNGNEGKTPSTPTTLEQAQELLATLGQQVSDLTAEREKLRKENADRRIKAREAEDKLKADEELKLRQQGELQKLLDLRDGELKSLRDELESLKQERAAEQAKALRLKAAKAAGFGDAELEEVANRLVGEDEGTLTADAKKLFSMLGARQARQANGDAGKGRGAGAMTTQEL